MLKLKLQYFGHLIWRTDSSEKSLMLGKLKAGGEGDDRVWNGWMTSLTQWTWVWTSSGSWWWTGKPSVLKSMGSQTVGTELLNWIELNWILRTDNGSTIQYVLFIQMFSQSMLMRLYVSLEICLSSRFMSVFFYFLGWPCANVISKCMLHVRGLVPFSEFWEISFL